MKILRLLSVVLFITYFICSCEKDNDNDVEDNEQSELVTIDGMRYIDTLSLLVDTTEVSISQYNQIMNDSEDVDSLLPKRCSYVDAILFCNKKSVEDGLNPVFSYDSIGVINKIYLYNNSVTQENFAYNLTIDTTQNGYRLPTYEEYQVLSASNWEGWSYYDWTNEVFYFNSDAQLLDVSAREPNDYGLYNLIGNICELELYTVEGDTQLYCDITDLNNNYLYRYDGGISSTFVLNQPHQYGIDVTWDLASDRGINDVLGDMTKVIYRTQFLKVFKTTIGTSYAGFRTVRKVD